MCESIPINKCDNYSVFTSCHHQCLQSKGKLTSGNKRDTPQSPGDDIVGDVYGDGSRLDDMWESLRLAETSWCPATANLPSRTRPTDTTLPRERDSISSRRDSCSLMRLSDLTGVSLGCPLTTVSDTMKRSYERSVNTILSVTAPQHNSSSNHRDQPKMRMKPIAG